MFVGFVGLLALGCGLRWVARSEATRWNSDEGISYLISTCHMLEYRRAFEADSPLFGHWVRARKWQRLVESDGRLCFGTVRDELSTEDVHPPLYFWFLHVWTFTFGRSIAAGMSLNLVFFGAGLVLLYQLARRAFASRVEALAACAIAAANVIGIRAALELRPYVLLSAVTVAYALMLVICCATPRPKWFPYLGLLLVTAAGLLTHYLFGFVVAASGLFALVRLVRRDPRRLFLLATAVLGGGAIAITSFPFQRQLGLRGSTTPPAWIGFDWDGDSLRMLRKYLLQPLGAETWALAAGLCAALVCWVIGRRLGLPRVRLRPWHHGWEMLVLFACAALGSLLPRAIALSPEHAVGVKYMGAVWFLAPLVPVFGIRVLGRAAAPALVILCAAYTAPALQAGWNQRNRLSLKRDSLPDRVVVTHAASRLHFPRFLPELSPRALLYVSDADDLERQEVVRGHSNFTYASCVASSSSSRLNRHMVRAFGKHFKHVGEGAGGQCWRLHRFRTPGTTPASSVQNVGLDSR